MSSANIETEAKFIVPDAGTFAALRQMDRLGNFEVVPIGVREVRDRYLDTAQKDLYHAGYACRIRHVKGHQLLTLKSLTPAEGDLHRRQEFELEIQADQPQAWPASEARRLVLEHAQGVPLETLFRLSQTRHKYHVRHQGRVVFELSLDEVLQNEGDEIDYFELEVELIETGTEDGLAQFIENLKATWLLQPETRSKFERALAYGE